MSVRVRKEVRNPRKFWFTGVKFLCVVPQNTVLDTVGRGCTALFSLPGQAQWYRCVGCVKAQEVGWRDPQENRARHNTQPVTSLPFPCCLTSLHCWPFQGPTDLGDPWQLLKVVAVLWRCVYFCSLYTWAEAAGSLPCKTVCTSFSWQSWEANCYSKIMK